jgi:uncharacterized protein
METRNFLNILSLSLVVIGGVNWGLVSIVGYDPLAPILGGYDSFLTRLVYALVGLSALWVFYSYIMTPGEDYSEVE